MVKNIQFMYNLLICLNLCNKIKRIITTTMWSFRAQRPWLWSYNFTLDVSSTASSGGLILRRSLRWSRLQTGSSLEMAPLCVASLLLDVRCDCSAEGNLFSVWLATLMSGDLIDWLDWQWYDGLFARKLHIVAITLAVKASKIILTPSFFTTMQGVTDLLFCWQWEILEHPPYSPDMGPCNYDLFAKLKEPLRGTRYNTSNELIPVIWRSIGNISKDGRTIVYDAFQTFGNIW